MDFAEYQITAQKTDQAPLTSSDDVKSLILPLLGLAGESGSLLTHYKRYLRDGEAYTIFRDRISEELGDILWNVANIATKTNLNLNEVAQLNLQKIGDRWNDQSIGVGAKLFDENFTATEQFPRNFEINVDSELSDQDNKGHAQLLFQAKQFGNELTDNAYEDDGYRLHDVFHLAFVAILGWSPVLRGKHFFNCKRKSDKDVDEVQDGGRAAVIDEAIVALIFTEAKKNSFFEGVDSVEYGLLRTIKDLTAHLEVSVCSGKQWEITILAACKIWRELKVHQHGKIFGDLNARSIKFVPCMSSNC
ncbi:nucleoside triphosphate pyrophosphohydrolase family protein [Undibacterium sp. Ji42W]|uniref:nucleoside triphosphate pyrophosphohydrolase family protein n=1 Tax=Undibacterium sp. Ji42W TaxID=3413039 RepID=UPI003BEF4D94